MWEWRIFYNLDQTHKKGIQIYNKTLRDLLQNAPVEHRVDYYYNLNEADCGLKERGGRQPFVFKPKLELKLLLDATEWGAELWDKCIKIQLQGPIDSNKGISLDLLLKFLTKESQRLNKRYSHKIGKIIEILQGSEIPRVRIEKTRKQITHYEVKCAQKAKSHIPLWIEETQLTLLDNSWISFEIESHNLDIIEQFLSKINLPKTGVVMGYPEFITSVVS